MAITITCVCLAPSHRATDGGINSGGYITCEHAALEWDVFTIIGVVVVVILVAGYFGIQGISF